MAGYAQYVTLWGTSTLCTLKEGMLRICINFRALNKQTKLDAYPIPRINDILDRLSAAQWFSKIDLSIAYY